MKFGFYSNIVNAVRALGVAHGSSAFLAMAVGCGPAAKPGVTPSANGANTVVSSSPTSPQGPSSAAPEPASPTPVVQAPPRPERDVRFDADWHWIRTRFPEAKAYRDAQHDSLPQALLDWAPAGGAITVFDRSCHAVQVRRGDDVLLGYIHRSFTLELDTLDESLGQIAIGARLDAFDGTTDTYERSTEGIWEQTASGGGESWTRVGYALSKVTADAAWYDDAVVSLSIECAQKVREKSVCRNGPQRTCERCEEWGLFPTSRESFGMSRAPATRKVVNRAPSDCSAPCPAIERPEDAKRAAEVLRGHDFFTAAQMAPHPFVFRTEDACKAYRKVHRFSRDELDAWRATDPVQSVER